MSDGNRYWDQQDRLLAEMEGQAKRLDLQEWLGSLKSQGLNVEAIPAFLRAATEFHRACGATDEQARVQARETLGAFLQAAVDRR